MCYLSFFSVVLGIGLSTAPGQADSAKQNDWTSLFNGKSLEGWTATEFGGEGDVEVIDERIQLGMGSPLTGVTYAGERALPKFDYEIRLEARRRDGTDFFCALTFPYGDSHCTLILGGWGGGLTGLSSFDGHDASDNETTGYQKFEKDRWYKVRVLVREGTIYAWLDGNQIIACAVNGRTVDTRPEVIRSKPLGIASFETLAEIRKIEMRDLSDDPDNEGGKGQ